MPKTWRYCESFRKSGGFFVSRFTNGGGVCYNKLKQCGPHGPKEGNR